jgi:asparagine synthase (glutamine-hydrolysing)
MQSPDGRYTIVFNGEIYNYQELRRALIKLGHSFVSESDTEVLLHAYMEWREECLQKLNGMFAFAVWDDAARALFAARDPLGEKPFKYWCDNGVLIFASELKAILENPEVARTPDYQAIDLALTYRYVPAPRTGFQGIYKLPPGHMLTFAGGVLNSKQYWRAGDFAREDARRSLPEWKELLWDTFKDSVRRRMISDVPLGAFLSGGLDSSSVVAAMSEVSDRPVKTFSVGFSNHLESETEYARAIAKHFKTDHVDVMIDPSIVESIPELVRHYEEPFFDNAAIPTLAMARETKKYATVVLTGDGADECFGGYPNHRFYDFLVRYQSMPALLYKRLIPDALGAIAIALPFAVFKKQRYRAELLSQSEAQAYADYYGVWRMARLRSGFYVTKADLYADAFRAEVDMRYATALMAGFLSGQGSPLNRAMRADIISRLPEDYLMKVDYAGMRHALEARAPFLDRRLVELALCMPASYKVRAGTVKWIWKEIVRGKLPAHIVARRKMGFGIPICAWMRGELNGYVRERLLGSRALKPLFKRSAIERLIADHAADKADYSNHIWSLILLSEWLEQYFPGTHD